MIFYFDMPDTCLKEFEPYQDFIFCNYDKLGDADYFDFCLKTTKPKILRGSLKGYSSRKYMIDFLTMGHSIDADVLAAPFIPFNYKRSFNLAYLLFDELVKRHMQNQFSIMLVPQGRNEGEIIECASRMARLPSNMLGMDIEMTKYDNVYLMEKMRFNIIQKLINSNLIRGKNLHLLELYGLQFLKAYKKAQRYFRIKSLNTDYPVSSAVHAHDLRSNKRRFLTKINDSTVLSADSKEIIKNNIKFIKEYK